MLNLFNYVDREVMANRMDVVYGGYAEKYFGVTIWKGNVSIETDEEKYSKVDVYIPEDAKYATPEAPFVIITAKGMLDRRYQVLIWDGDQFHAVENHRSIRYLRELLLEDGFVNVHHMEKV